MAARAVQPPSSDLERFVSRCSDKYEIMPKKKKEELVLKVVAVAILAGIISLPIFPIAPIVAVIVGLAAFFYYADQYTAGEFISDVINNPTEYMNRSREHSFQDACARRVQEDGAFAIRNVGSSIQSWWNRVSSR